MTAVCGTFISGGLPGLTQSGVIPVKQKPIVFEFVCSERWKHSSCSGAFRVIDYNLAKILFTSKFIATHLVCIHFLNIWCICLIWTCLLDFAFYTVPWHCSWTFVRNTPFNGHFHLSWANQLPHWFSFSVCSQFLDPVWKKVSYSDTNPVNRQMYPRCLSADCIQIRSSNLNAICA